MTWNTFIVYSLRALLLQNLKPLQVDSFSNLQKLFPGWIINIIKIMMIRKLNTELRMLELASRSFGMRI